MIIVNGEEQNCAGMTVLAYLNGADYDCSRIAVERNGCIVPKSTYADTLLQEGDVLEVVRFVGGG